MKYKIRLLLIVSATIFSGSTYSQNVFGFKAGMQLAKITGAGDVPHSLLPTLQVKGVAILPLGDEVTINPSLGYSGKGYKWTNISFEDQLGNSLGDGDVIGLFHYLQLTVPLTYKIVADGNQEYYFGAGPYFSYAVSGKGKLKHVAVSSEEETWDLFADGAYKRTDAGIAVEIASQLKKKFLISFNADIGLSDISKQGGGKLKHLAGGLSFGYLFAK